MPGYSETPLVKKLGIKGGITIALLHEPKNYRQLLTELPDVTITLSLKPNLDFIQYFTNSQETLKNEFSHLKSALKPDGMLWISWPKKSAKIPSDLNENIIRDIGLNHGLVDVKVVAVDENWSGLKFVYRLRNR